ncbi:hypothetical protein [Siccibacter turicensis]|uniref:hypothetical protein n=1 Tax=Siccibacter turicensis TaxID=357233 RepID=UPI003F5625D8
MSKLTREMVAKAMLSSFENYLFEIVDSIESDVGDLTPEECYSLNAWVRGAVESAAEKVEATHD